MSFRSSLRDWWKSSNTRRLRKYINPLYYDHETVIINYKNFDYLGVDGCKFVVSDQIDSVQRVSGNNWFANIRANDICLDIGANIGAITIPLAKMANHVFAVEPVKTFADTLSSNINLNQLKNVSIIPYALGASHRKILIQFGRYSDYAETKSFAELKEIAGGKIDWLKIDCEGAEWEIDPHELIGIREIRAELHYRRGIGGKDETHARKWLDTLRQAEYSVATDIAKQPGSMVPFYKCELLRASKKK